MQLHSPSHSTNEHSEDIGILFDLTPKRATALLAAYTDARRLLKKHGGRYYGHVAIEFDGPCDVVSQEVVDTEHEGITAIALEAEADPEDYEPLRTECWTVLIWADGDFSLRCLHKHCGDMYSTDLITLTQMKKLAAGKNPFPIVPATAPS